MAICVVQVPKENYGLAPEEILSLDDKQLNRLVGLKRLNPYREDQGRFCPNSWLLKQMRKELGSSNEARRWAIAGSVKTRPKAGAPLQKNRSRRAAGKSKAMDKAGLDQSTFCC